MADQHASFTEALDSPADNAAVITPGASALSFVTRGIYVGTSGDLNVTMNGGGDVLFTSVPAGAILPIRVSHILSTSTTADDIVALW